jgi:hemolysin activation/secretion protein
MLQTCQDYCLEGAFCLAIAAIGSQPLLAQSEMPALPQSLPAETLSVPASLILHQVRLEGSTVFSQAQVNAAVADYLGKSVTFEDLLAIQTRLSELYLQAGYVTSLVILPEQENPHLDSGTVGDLPRLRRSARRPPS